MSIDLAFRYPYPAPQRSFIWHDDGRVVFQDQGLSPEICAGRFAVLAVGSNRSPEQLTRKKNRFGLCGMIPVEPLRIRDYDVVYSAHIAPYGAIPAMLQYVPGALVEISITWLDASQLVAMDESEAPFYQRCFLEKPDMIFPERLSPMSVVARAAPINFARPALSSSPRRPNQPGGEPTPRGQPSRPSIMARAAPINFARPALSLSPRRPNQPGGEPTPRGQPSRPSIMACAAPINFARPALSSSPRRPNQPGGEPTPRGQPSRPSIMARAAPINFARPAKPTPRGQPSRLSVDLQSYICLAGEWGGHDGEGFSFRAVRSFSPLHSRVRVTTRRVLSEIFIDCLRHQSSLSKASGDFHNFMQLLIDDTVFREDVKILLSKTRKPFAAKARVAKA